MESMSLLRKLLSILFVIVVCMQCSYAAPNELQKVFHHRMVTDTPNALSHIEWGKVVLYFAQDPIVKKNNPISSTHKKGHQEVTYFIPNAIITSAEAKKMIAVLHTTASENYTVKITQVANPIPGITINISYDPKMVMIEYDFFDAITGAKGLEFRLYNKALLESLKQKGQSVLRTAQARKPTIIIDCGHGGHDTGTIGFFNTIEKNITLAVGKQLGQELRKQGMCVAFTRSDDQFMALDERTLIANRLAPDAMLISLHANNAPKKEVRGLETFCVSPHLFKKEHFGLETAIDVMINQYDAQRYAQSKKLAECVHRHILEAITKNGYRAYDRRVREAATQVLMGARCPGILVEMEYVSNEQAAHLLKNDPRFSHAIIQGICKGVQEYVSA